MRLNKKWAAQSALFSVFATIVILVIVNVQLRKYGIEAAEEKAKLILLEKQATIHYVIHDLRPGLFKLIREKGMPTSYFEPSWMSAGYLNRTIMNYFNDSEFSEYYYKNAAVNARSPHNEADRYEKEFLEKVSMNPELDSWSDIVDFEGKPFFIYMQPNSSKFSKGCMPCHSIPENAPADLIALYGSERSFNKKIGDLPSVLSLRIPMQEVYASINALTIVLSLFIGSILGIIFLVQWFIVKRSIIAPIKIITTKSSAIAGDESLLGEKIIVSGRDELAEMADAFSDMSQKLARSKDNLEILVAERTRQLSESKDQAQKYLDIAGVMLAALNRSGEITMLNQKGCAILGISNDDAIGLNWFDHFIPQRMQDEIKGIFAQLMQGKIDAVEYYENHIVTRSGEERLLAFRNTLLTDGAGDIIGILWSGEDVTDKRRFEAEKEQLEAQLRQTYKMEAIGTLAGGIAHDFNNILAAILGYADMARDDTPDYSPAKYQIEQVLKAGNRAADLVKHILAFSRKEAQERVPVKIHPIITDSLQLLSASLPSTIEIRQEIDHDCGYILAEPAQINQVVLNLCANAAQSMGETGGVLQVELTSVTLAAADLVNEPTGKPGCYAQLSVKDNGLGIDQKDIERIFDPYFTTKEVGQGSGMGLAVVIGIVKSHDGMVTVQSTMGEGTTFKVFFPRIEAKAQPKPEDAGPLPTGNEKILVVDDEESMVKLTARRLERLGYQVTTATSSMESLELFRSKPGSFDLVISDQTMPDLTGEMLAKKILEIRPDIPIILCTGYSATIDAEKAHLAGIAAFIMKPVDNRELAATVRKVLDDRS